MQEKYYIGIDPGKDGAYVVLREDGQLSGVGKFPLVGKEYDAVTLASMLREVSNMFPNVKAAIEKVGAAPNQGAVSMFTFGYGTGLLVGMLAAYSIPFTQVRPQVWQSVTGAIKDSAGKKTSPRRALELFPGSLDAWLNRNGRLDEGIADAILIAEWARRTLK